MKNTCIAIIVALTSYSGAMAQESEAASLSSCRAISDSLQRLTCYDNLADVTIAAPEASEDSDVAESPNAEVAGSAPWTLAEQADPISGADTSFAFIDASNQLNGSDSPESLVLRCDGDGSFRLSIWTSGHIGSGGSRNRISVEYKWGENEPIEENWNAATNGNAAFLPKGYNDFMSGLRDGGRLAFRWEDYRGSANASIWEDVQLDENAEFVLRGCD